MRYRKIDPRIWNDERFRLLGDDGKLVFLFVLTHPHMTAIGAMRASVDGLAAELGWRPRRFKAALGEIVTLRMAEHDDAASFLSLPNFLRYNEPEGPNSVKHAWAASLDNVPECAGKRQLVARCRAYLQSRSAKFRDAMGDGILDAFADAIPDGKPQPSPILELELEQELELELKPPLPPYGGDVSPSQAIDWLQALNDLGGLHFTATPTELRPINARIRDGFTLEQARTVITAKVAEWAGSDFAKYLRPATLFGPKFDGYLQAAANGKAPRASRHFDAWGKRP